MKSILLVDDEQQLLRLLGTNLRNKGYMVHTAENGKEAREVMEEQNIDVVFLDLMLPDTTGLELLQEFVPRYPGKAFNLMTAYSNVESAVSAMKAGAFDYIVKPAKLDEILIVIERAAQWLGIKEENHLLKERLKQSDIGKAMIGQSLAMKPIYQLVERVANTDATVLLTGESGTGKSMVANLIHEESERREKPFIAVNCAAIPEQLLESELFGYEKGAFTGANASRQGKFEAADGGTLFLDEIGEISLSLQAKLLQAIQEKKFMRLGSNEMKKVDVRILSATNRDLRQMVDEGAFREDLYYRLNIVDIYIPTLRERKDDIPLLVEEFLSRHRRRYEKKFQVSAELMIDLMNYEWPGNVRELENAMERAVILSQDEVLTLSDFPRKIRELKKQDNDDPFRYQIDPSMTLVEQLQEMERQLIIQALEESNGHGAAAARRLGITRQNLFYRMNKYDRKPTSLSNGKG